MVDNEREMIDAFAKTIGTQMLYFVPRDNMVQKAEIHRKTVIDYEPTHPQAQHYRNLSQAMDENEMFVVPKPMEIDVLEKLLMDYGLFG